LRCSDEGGGFPLSGSKYNQAQSVTLGRQVEQCAEWNFVEESALETALKLTQPLSALGTDFLLGSEELDVLCL
jgi:hypothetical protein